MTADSERIISDWEMDAKTHYPTLDMSDDAVAGYVEKGRLAYQCAWEAYTSDFD